MAIALSGSVQLKTALSGDLVFDSWTPGADLVAILMVAQRIETVSIVSVTGNNLTWTLVRDKNAGRGQCGLEVWKGVGASPTTGTTTVATGVGATVVSGIIQQFSGIDPTTPIEADAADTHGAVDDTNMLASVTTLTANAWAVACGVARNVVFTVPGSDTAAISINQTAGSGGDLIKAHMWYEGPVTTPASTQLGALADLNATSDWAEVVVSVKPAAAAVFPRAPVLVRQAVPRAASW